MMSKSPNDVIGTLMSIGIFASINQRLDAETLTMVAEEFGFTVEFVSADVTASVVQDSQNPENMLGKASNCNCNGACRSRKNIFVRLY